MATILQIDDDREILEITQKYLTSEGFRVYIADSAKGGIAYARKYFPDCILLDIMMPDIDGYEVCRKIRSFSTVPILFITGKSAEDDKITGLTCGADDYIVKPYSLRELKARIDILLRRMEQLKAASDSNLLLFGNLKIDKLAHKALFLNQDLCLANREYEVLLYLAEHPNREITFEELGNALFGTYQESDRRSVMVNVSRLRKKMACSYELENMIETVWSKGYKFIKK